MNGNIGSIPIVTQEFPGRPRLTWDFCRTKIKAVGNSKVPRSSFIDGPNRNRVLLILFAWSLFFLPALLEPAEVPSFFGIRPGSTTRAEVELLLGEPQAALMDVKNVYEYQPPSGAADARKIVIGYFDDTREVSRVDVHLKTPLAAASLRDEFGRRALVQDRSDGLKEEFYFPRYQGFVYASDSTGDSVIAVVFVSPRYLSGLFIARFNKSLTDKNYEQARLDAEKAVLADPDFAQALTALARYYNALKDYDQALAQLAKAVNAKYSPATKAEAHAWTGFILRHQKKSPEAAAKEFKQAIAVSADFAPAHFQLGDLLLSQDNKDQAAAEFAKTLELDPKHIQARIKLADYLYDKKEYGKALDHYEKLSSWTETGALANADNGIKALIHFRHGYCLTQTSGPLAPEYEKRIEAFKKAIELNGTEDLFYANLGLAYEDKEDWTEAEQAYRKGLGLRPDSAFLSEHLGLALLGLRRFQEALSQLERALPLNSDDPNLMMDIARCQAALKKKGQAKDWIKKAVQAGYRDTGIGLHFDPYLQEVFTEKELTKLLEKKS
jgi:tetratricopeptide (TPR) repeat protein